MDKPALSPDADPDVEPDPSDPALPPIRYILFPRKGGWPSFPYPDIAALLSVEGDVYYVSNSSCNEGVPTVITVISLPEAEQLLAEPRTVAVVTHPYWLMTTASMEPELCIVLLPEPAGNEAKSPLFVRAELLRINDDYGNALHILDELGGETARHWKFRIYQEIGRVEDALALRGKRHGAVRHFLETALEDENALARIVELELLDHAVQQLLGDVP